MSPCIEIENQRVMTRDRRNRSALAASCALVALAAGCVAPEDGAPAHPGVDAGSVPSSATALGAEDRAPLAATPDGFRVPVDLRPSCEYLRALPEPPADLDLAAFYACLTDESFATLDRMYRASPKADPRAPTLAAFAAEHGRTLVRDRLGHRGAPWSRFTPGTAPADGVSGIAAHTLSSFGFDPLAHCGSSTSCLSASVPVVGTTRTIGYRPAVTQPGLNPGTATWRTARHLDGIDYGTAPSARQSSLADPELRAAGCGPIAAINLFDWWNIPIVDGSGRELTNLDERATFFSTCMRTLDGMNFTDDEDLFSCIDGHMADMQRRGFITARPASYVAMGDRAELKRLVHEVSIGHPVIALYATGSFSMHWAVITGIVGDQVRFANGSSMSLARFYEEWDNWESLDWLAEIGIGTAVDPNTIYVLTGFGSSAQPARFGTRASTTQLPSYGASTGRQTFRYCLPGPDLVGTEAERPHLATWLAEPSTTNSDGYCLFNGTSPGFELQIAPQGGVLVDAALRSFINAQPGATATWWGFDAAGTATELQRIVLRSVASASHIPAPIVGASIVDLQFIVHTRDFAQLRRPAADFASRQPVFFYDAAARDGYRSSISSAGAYVGCGPVAGFGAWTHVAGAANGALLFYNTTTGAAYVSRMTAPCTYSSLQPVTAFTPGFTHVVAANEGGFFLYNARTGITATGSVDDAGRFRPGYTSTGFPPFTHVAGTRGGGLFLYNAATGAAQTLRMDADDRLGAPTPIAGLATGWTHVVGANTGSLFFYNAATGTAATGRLDANAQWHHVSVLGGFGLWHKIVGASNGGILFYNSSSGTGYTGVIDAQGNYRTVSPLSGFRTTWSNIVAM